MNDGILVGRREVGGVGSPRGWLAVVAMPERYATREPMPRSTAWERAVAVNGVKRRR